MKGASNWRQNKPQNAAKKRWWKAQKGWERNTTKLHDATVLGKVLRDQMAKGVIYPFAYFCNTECSKIIYGFGINTEAVGSLSLSPPPRPATSWLQLGGGRSSRITNGLLRLPPTVARPKRAAEYQGSCNGLQVCYSACCEEGRPKPSCSMWAEMARAGSGWEHRLSYVCLGLAGGMLCLQVGLNFCLSPRGGMV